ncbi:MAG: sulfatase-like hydrolase/transferase, partial [Pseudomonadota bacterium]
MRLNRFYVQPSCTPTRAALMTGKSPVRMGIFNPLSKNNPTGLPLVERTLADHLKSAGYETALVGKWHLGARDRRYHPNSRGFDHFYGHLTGGVGYWDKVHGGGYDWQRNGKTVRDARYATHLIADEAIERIKQRDPEKPLFLYAAFAAPHLPNEAPEHALDEYQSIANDNRRAHAAMVSELDRSISRVHAAIIEAGIEENTLLWFMSDNGGLIAKNPARFLPEPLFSMALERTLGVETSPIFSEFALANLRDGGSDNGPFRGGKTSPDEGGVRVPAFVYWPGVFDSGAYDYMATVQDVLPTLLEISGVAVDEEGLDGRSLWTPVHTSTPA